MLQLMGYVDKMQAIAEDVQKKVTKKDNYSLWSNQPIFLSFFNLYKNFIAFSSFVTKNLV